jgi:para-aminobenzoate synthetase / 4-amino-4-deoxychorismate lyase
MKFDDIINHIENNIYSALFYTPPIFRKSYSYFFTDPFEIISVKDKNELELALHFLDEYSEKKTKGFCLINYETGYLFEPKLNNHFKPSDKKVLQLFFFDDKNVQKIKSIDIEIDFKQKKLFDVSKFELNTTKKKFLSDINKIKKEISLGNTYQVNYTIKGKFNLSGSLSSFLTNLLFNQSAEYSSFINTGVDLVFSFSPELFLSIKGKNIRSIPMKGTGKRGFDLKSDLLNQYSLQRSEKNQAENVMIVDLIRNDLGRVCKTESINVSDLYSVKRLESLFQMTSTVNGKLEKDVSLSQVLKSTFPCGSVTGAPKIKTMEIINKFEKEERGIYTGGIGLFTKSRKVFNVPIRTITLNQKTGKGEIGLGSGIVWDSEPEEEFNEVNLKSEFLTKETEYFELFETMKLENGRILFTEEHLERLKNSCEFFLFNFPEKRVRKKLDKICKENPRGFFRLKLQLGKTGLFKTEMVEYPYLPAEVKIIVSEKRIDQMNKFQYFKTTNRKLYEEELQSYSSKGFFEVIYLNNKEELAEGSFTNIFIRKRDLWYTPPLAAGILPGIYRTHFIKTTDGVKEIPLHINDLYEADEILLTNSLRGEIKVDAVYFDEQEFKTFD